jgi:hypothetical protein
MEQEIRYILEGMFPNAKEFQYDYAIRKLLSIVNQAKRYEYPKVYPKPITKKIVR